MRLLLILVLMIAATSSSADAPYDENGEYTGNKYTTTKSATTAVALKSFGVLVRSSKKAREVRAKIFKTAVEQVKQQSNFKPCDKVCKAKIQQEVVAKYSQKY